MAVGLLVPPRKKDDKKPAKAKRPKQANAKLAEDLVHKLGVISQWRKKSIGAPRALVDQYKQANGA